MANLSDLVGFTLTVNRVSQGSLLPKSHKLLSIDDSSHAEDSRLKITENIVVKPRISVNNSSPSRVKQNLQVTDHKE